MRSDKFQKYLPKILFCLIILTAVLVRAFHYPTLPGGVNQDEAYAAYEAYSLLHYGHDSHGYAFPVYLIAWGSGMNALNTYLMIPFIALFGLHVWVLRLPQLITAIVTVICAYFFMKKITGEKIALLSAFVLAVCPWHIMLSRWGLESNLAPAFLLFGLFFFLYGLENPRFFPVSALMYGLSLYCYATIWPVVPLIIIAQFLYALYFKKIKCSAHLIFSGIILTIMAIPLFLFLLINFGVIQEISLPFFSVPKLLYMRSEEISFRNLLPNLKNLLYIIIFQKDDYIWNSIPGYSLIYYFTPVFSLIGLGRICIRQFKRKQYDPAMFLVIQFLGAFILGILVLVNVNRINIIFIPLILLAGIGMEGLFSAVGQKLIFGICILYLFFFVRFARYYFIIYPETINYCFDIGLEEALNEAASYPPYICVSSAPTYAKYLYYAQIPVDDFLATIIYKENTPDYLEAYSFERYLFDFNTQNPSDGFTYVLKEGEDDMQNFSDEIFIRKNYGSYSVFIPKCYLETNSEK